jgi:hypothetical protein
MWHRAGYYWFYKKLRHGIVEPKREIFDLWIDGYPRSANTFAFECLKLYYPEKRILTHMHSPFVASSCIKNNIAGILLIREPAKAVVSYSIMSGHTLFNSLDYYFQYYRRIMPLKEYVYISDFSCTTSNPKSMIKGFCTFYGLNPSDIKLDVDLQQKAIARINKHYTGSDGTIDLDRVARPEKKRKSRSNKLISAMYKSRFMRSNLRKCEQLYQQMLPLANVAESGSRGFFSTISDS